MAARACPRRTNESKPRASSLHPRLAGCGHLPSRQKQAVTLTRKSHFDGSGLQRGEQIPLGFVHRAHITKDALDHGGVAQPDGGLEIRKPGHREAGKTKNRTLKNLSDWPAERIEQLRAVLRGEQLLPATDAVEIVRALPHGHVLAALGTARRIEFDALLPRRASQRRRDLALALIVARLLDPAAKLATARMLDAATASDSLGEMLGLGSVTAKDVYATLDWLGSEQSFIETALARRHLSNGALLLYDVTSTYLEGRCCELARHGYSRDHRRDRAQLVIGLLCAVDGCPVAVEVFEGNTADPMTLSPQIDKLKQRFKLQRVVMVGDRGLLTSARIEETLRPAGLDWITALRAPAIKALAAEGGPLQPSLFDTRDMAEINSPDYPGERLVVCKNPLLGQERAPKRSELLAATEKELIRIQARVQRASKPLHGAAAIGQAVGAVLGRRKMAKHFQISIGDDTFGFARDDVAIAAEAALDGIYVVLSCPRFFGTPICPTGGRYGEVRHEQDHAK